MHMEYGHLSERCTAPVKGDLNENVWGRKGYRSSPLRYKSYPRGHISFYNIKAWI